MFVRMYCFIAHPYPLDLVAYTKLTLTLLTKLSAIHLKLNPAAVQDFRQTINTQFREK